MTPLAATFRMLFGVVVASAIALEGNAQAIFVDDFNDGNAEDGVPVSWSSGAFPAGTRSASSGDFVMTPSASGMAMSAVVQNVLYKNAAILTQVNMEGPDFDSIGLFARGMESDAYIAAIEPNGTLFVTRFENGLINILGTASTNLDVVANDVYLKFDFVDSMLSLTAWADGSPKPMTPQITVHDNGLSNEGAIGMSFLPGGGQHAATFSSFEVVGLPEPASVPLLFIGLVIAFLLFGRTNR